MKNPFNKAQLSNKQKLIDVLAQLEPSNIRVFNKIYGSIEQIKKDDIIYAIRKAERTLKTNNKRKEAKKKGGHE